jgi:hypothetical protein
MSRSSRKPTHQQYPVGIERDSDLNAFYRKEAADHDVGVPTWIHMLLEARWRGLNGQEWSLWFPPGYQFQTAAANVALALPPPPPPTITPEDALSAFGGLDDDEDDSPTLPMRAIH